MLLKVACYIWFSHYSSQMSVINIASGALCTPAHYLSNWKLGEFFSAGNQRKMVDQLNNKMDTPREHMMTWLPSANQKWITVRVNNQLELLSIVSLTFSDLRNCQFPTVWESISCYGDEPCCRSVVLLTS